MVHCLTWARGSCSASTSSATYSSHSPICQYQLFALFAVLGVIDFGSFWGTDLLIWKNGGCMAFGSVMDRRVFKDFVVIRLFNNDNHFYIPLGKYKERSSCFIWYGVMCRPCIMARHAPTHLQICK